MHAGPHRTVRCVCWQSWLWPQASATMAEYLDDQVQVDDDNDSVQYEDFEDVDPSRAALDLQRTSKEQLEDERDIVAIVSAIGRDEAEVDADGQPTGRRKFTLGPEAMQCMRWLARCVGPMAHGVSARVVWCHGSCVVVTWQQAERRLSIAVHAPCARPLLQPGGRPPQGCQRARGGAVRGLLRSGTHRCCGPLIAERSYTAGMSCTKS